eukprot:5345166-Prorocentrum_lima.AAC.1
MTSSLVGSEMCIRDRCIGVPGIRARGPNTRVDAHVRHSIAGVASSRVCLLYTATLPTICSV